MILYRWTDKHGKRHESFDPPAHIFKCRECGKRVAYGCDFCADCCQEPLEQQVPSYDPDTGEIYA